MVEQTKALQALPVVVTDACDANVADGCQIVSVTSDESVNSRGDGNSLPDYEITGKLTLNLRAERSGGGNGRAYTIGVACTDASGNGSAKTVAVKVAHNQ